MKVNNDLHLIILPLSFGGQTRDIILSLSLDPSNGATLIDTGLPDQEDEILAQCAAAGVSPREIERIILTHHDIDHMGSAAALVETTGAKVLALAEEAPYIDGRKTPQKAPPPERLAQMPEFKAVLDRRKTLPVDELLNDGQILDIAGGVKVVATPGHTVGHLSLYLERSKTIIAGDALTSENGHLNGPMEGATPDMDTALASVKKLAALDVEAIVCYHGGVVDSDAGGQLRRVAGV